MRGVASAQVHALIKASLAAPVLSEEVLRRPPKAVERSGRRAVEVWLDFFTAALANDNTRAAYKRGLHEFFQFVELQPDTTLDQVTARISPS